MIERFVLASSSPYRKQLLQTILPSFECIKPNVDERKVAAETSQTLSIKLAKLKAQSIARTEPATSLIIGSDQVACRDGEILHKPGDRESTIFQLQQSTGKTVEFHTAFCLILDHQIITGMELTRAHFRDLSEQEIIRYVEAEPAYDCAGGFKAEGLGITLFDRLESGDPTALIGLPLIKLCNALRKLGVELP